MSDPRVCLQLENGAPYPTGICEGRGPQLEAPRGDSVRSGMERRQREVRVAESVELLPEVTGAQQDVQLGLEEEIITTAHITVRAAAVRVIHLILT